MGTMEKSIKLNLKPDGEGIESAGQRSGHFLKSHGVSDEAVQFQIRILKKLIKNGLKYGRPTPSKDELSISIQFADNAITLEVMNPVDITCRDRLKELDRTIQFIRGYQDPFEAYMLMKNESPNQSSHRDDKDLDLFKTALEGNVILDFFINENNILNQSAVRSLMDT
jgi:hypothetical protein